MYYNSPTSPNDREQRILKNLTEIGGSPRMLKKKSKYYNDGKGEDDSIFKRKPRLRSVSKSSEFDIKFHEIPLEREDKTMKEEVKSTLIEKDEQPNYSNQRETPNSV